MSIRRLTTTSLLILCALSLATSPASAGTIHRYQSQITEVPEEPGVVSGTFGLPLGLATDSGNLYVLDPGKSVIDEYNPFNTFVSQISGAGLFGFKLGGQTAEGVAVNHSTGEVYVANNTVDVFSEAGEHLATWTGEDTPDKNLGQSNNQIAVDNSTNPADPVSGNVYVSEEVQIDISKVPQVFGLVNVFRPEPSGKEKYVTQITGTPTEPVFKQDNADRIAVDDTTGDVIVSGSDSNIVSVFRPKTASTYEFLFELTGPPGKRFAPLELIVTEHGGTIKQKHEDVTGAITGVAVDDSTGDIYVADGEGHTSSGVGDGEGNTVYEFSSSGEYLGEVTSTSSGPFVGLAGVAVGSNGDLYVDDSGARAVDAFSANVLVPDVSTGAPLSKSVGVTFNGTVNPSGTRVTACRFEYGATISYGSVVPCSAVPGPGSSPVAVAASLTGQTIAPGITYHYRLAATDEEGETVYGHDETLFTPPIVRGTVLASEISSYAATLTGVIDPGEFTPTYHFLYGLSGAYGSVWPEPEASTGVGAQQTVSQTLTGLQPDTTYHVALVARNFGGSESVSPDATFTTRPLVPPAVDTGMAQAVGQTTATLTGTVNPEGLASTYRFEYGTSTGYGSSWPLVVVFAGSASTVQGVAINVPNLRPGTTYHYRLVASNEDGTSYGADRVFTTPDYPMSIVQEPPGLAPLASTTVRTTKPVFKHRASKKKQKKKKTKPKKKK